MAKIIGALATSHTPTIGFAVDRDKRSDPDWAPIFAAYEPLREWLGRARPDVLLYVYNDHVTSFFFDHYSMFALGIGTSWESADEGSGPRNLPSIAGHPELAQHIGACLVAEEFDMAFFQGKPLDHGCFSPLSAMMDYVNGWPVALVPLQVGVLQFPVPSASRCYKLGAALRRAIESYPVDVRVAIVATGGLSHQVHGERSGYNDVDWDRRFLELIEKDPVALTRVTLAEFAKLGGMEGAEVIMWLIMRGALPAAVKCMHKAYYLPSMTGIAVAIFEPESPACPGNWQQPYLEGVSSQLKGIEEVSGTYPFTLATSSRCYRVNRFLHDLIIPEKRATFRANERAAMAVAGLASEEVALVSQRDWRGLIHYGASFFVLEKLAAVVGMSNLHIYAHMRGEPLEQFLKTRNAPGALYSVAGTESGDLEWDKSRPHGRP